MVTLAEACRMALSLPEATEEDHHGIPSFRAGNKIFATVPDDEHLRIMLDAHTTHAVVTEDPLMFEELWWGKKLSGVCVTLGHADRRRLAELLEEAWRRIAPRRLLLRPGEGVPAVGGSASNRRRKRR